MVDNLFFSRCCKLVDHELAIFLFLDQPLCDLALLRGDRPVVLDAPYRQAAHDQKDHQQRQPGEIGRRVAEIDG